MVTKKQVQQYVSSLGSSSAYSGNTRTLYINNKKEVGNRGIEEQILSQFGELSFKLRTNPKMSDF